MNEEEEKKDEETVAHDFNRGKKDESCQKSEEYLNGWKRALADYDNLKKDLSNERARMRQMAIEHTAHQLIPVLDHFDQALRFKPAGVDASVENWLEGILHVRTQLEAIILEMGIEPFGKEGEMFDPYLHETASEEVREGAVPGTILQVVQRGWKRESHVIRPAKVIIAK
jgi:molecular chaperone GrpE